MVGLAFDIIGYSISCGRSDLLNNQEKKVKERGLTLRNE